MPKTKKKKAEENTEEKEAGSLVVNIENMEQPSKPRYLCLYGEINEDNCYDVINSLLYLHKTGKNVVSFSTEDGEKLNTVEVIEPVELYVSTHGGSANDMFALYDVMKNIQEEGTEVITTGLGKVMSAGVLVLAAGTKGKRRIGKNCRVMIHGVIAGQHGKLHDIENEMEEVRWIQERYIQALCEDSNMTKKYIKKLLDRKVNVYLDAKEAIELGIADELI
jgi:ATP-dependent Clp protease protease subunit